MIDSTLIEEFINLSSLGPGGEIALRTLGRAIEDRIRADERAACIKALDALVGAGSYTDEESVGWACGVAAAKGAIEERGQ